MERVRFYWRAPHPAHGPSNTSLLATRAAMKARADLIACGLGSGICTCSASRHRPNLLGLNSGPMLKNLLVLGIESSCDETGVALVETRGGAVPVLLSHALHSQIDMHQAYGGVVPELASRDHIRRVLPLTREVMAQAQRSLAAALARPVMGVHHLEGHLLSPFLSVQSAPAPCHRLLRRWISPAQPRPGAGKGAVSWLNSRKIRTGDAEWDFARVQRPRWPPSWAICA